MNNRQLRWLTVALTAFNMAWGVGNVVNSYAQQRVSIITSRLLILAAYLVPYALIVGQSGSVFKGSKGSVSLWVENTTSSKRLACYAAWAYWVVHTPYLVQGPQAILIAGGWTVQGNGNIVSTMSVQMVAVISLIVFLVFLYLSTKGLSILKVIGRLTGIAMFVMSILLTPLAVTTPSIDPTVEFATPYMNRVKTYIPAFDFSYFTTVLMLVFAIRGTEKVSPYISSTRNPAKEFPKGVIFLVVMVGICAVLDSVAMGILFASDNIPKDLIANRACSALQILGNYYGIGNSLMIAYALIDMVGQIFVLAFSIDVSLRILLTDTDPEFAPNWLRKRNRKDTLVNGYLLTGMLVGVVILLPIFGIKDMNELVKWLTNLNSVVMPVRYLWVSLAYMMLNKAYKKFNSEYKFVKNPKIGFISGAWCFVFTAFTCILEMVPKVDYTADPKAWWSQLFTNIITLVVLILLGMILPTIARWNKNEEITEPGTVVQP